MTTTSTSGAEAPRTEPVVRLGILGTGTQGSAYARFIAEGLVPHMSLGALSDTDPAARAAASETHPGVPTFATLHEMLASGSVDAVVTTIPHYEHPAAAITSIEAGFPTLVEKPAAVHTSQVRRMNEVAAAHPEVPFAIMFNQRNNPLYRRIKEIVEAGEIGEVLRSTWIITTWWRPQGYFEQSAWRATWGGEGGGVLVNQSPHQLDLWQWICGIPKSVFAKAGFGFRRDIAVEDEVTALVDYGDGRTGTFITCTHDMKGTDRLEILGSRGKILVEGSKTATVHRYAKSEKEISDATTPESARELMRGNTAGQGDLVSTETIEDSSVWGGQHAGVLENFARHVLFGEDLLAPGSDGIHGVRLANAIHLSAWTGREVPLDFDESEYLAELNKRIAAEGKYPQQQG
ncbi:Gfo/Idh/MocA family protein [Brachybacterium sp. GCM10030267]|uniref:Gfo/Idh/MocA family protein n=1 Tax=unclassified Brachybacterium TaxID=2623841 RepID=UPI00360E9BF0